MLPLPPPDPSAASYCTAALLPPSPAANVTCLCLLPLPPAAVSHSALVVLQLGSDVMQNIVYSTKSILFATVITIPCKTIRKKNISKTGHAKGIRVFLQPQCVAQSSFVHEYLKQVVAQDLQQLDGRWYPSMHPYTFDNGFNFKLAPIETYNRITPSFTACSSCQTGWNNGVSSSGIGEV